MSGFTATATADRWREALVKLGFSDDGDRLRGPVRWNHRPPEGPTRGLIARVEIILGEAFPFAPPHVVILDPGANVELTFHRERSGQLCLWDNDWAVDTAPWLDPVSVVSRIAGWLQKSAASWPSDDDCDLERYLERDNTLILYDVDKLAPGTLFRTSADSSGEIVTVTDERRRKPTFQRNRRHRKDARLVWVADIGAVERPLWNWSDVRTALGDDADEIGRLIGVGAVRYLLLRYTRGPRNGVLALRCCSERDGVQVEACESADSSMATRALRAGPDAARLRTTAVAVVGCGAIGSFAADLLFRAGVRQFTLIDHERLRPGNVVRHLAGRDRVGQYKSRAVRDSLAEIDSDVSTVTAKVEAVVDLEDACRVVASHDIVVDATADARASSLLATAAGLTGNEHVVVSACAQRRGEVVRVDRMPLRPDEAHLPPLTLSERPELIREQGCGSPVSMTPPAAVIAAAALTCRVVIDAATRRNRYPATVAEVHQPQPEPPFDRIGFVTSTDTAHIDSGTCSATG